MKVARIVWLPEALEDIERLYDFLKEKSPVAAMRAAQTILQGARILEESPEAGRPMQDDTGRREFFAAFGAGLTSYVTKGIGTRLSLFESGTRKSNGIEGQAGLRHVRLLFGKYLSALLCRTGGSGVSL